MSGGLDPLRERAFRVLFFGRLVSGLGSAVAPVALAFAVLDLTGAAGDLGVVLAANIAPQLVFLVVGGVVADRLPRGAVMVAANVVSAVGQGVTASVLLWGRPSVPLLAALAAITGIAAAFFGPASQGVVPQTVPAEQLARANALLRISLNTVRVLGPALGGVAVAAAGPAWAIGWDALTFVAAAVLLGLLRVPLPARAPSHFLGDLRDGWSEFWSRRWLWAIVLQYALVNMVWVGGFQLLGPVIADRALGGPVAWGLITAGLAAGLVAGAVVVLWWRPGRPLLVASVATLTKVAPLLGLAAHAPTPVLVACAAVAGVGVEIFSVSFTTAMQHRVPTTRLSRVSSYDLLFGLAFMPLGYLVAGPVSDALGVTTTLLAGVVLVAGSTAVVLCLAEVRSMRSEEPGGLRRGQRVAGGGG
ncbi:MFS transporter [Actinosynnema sp. NPDC050436]|uniref:MFS transporter n=1 Tax=Actinosynnema sp. NPDC050436 TaxID=3155659 RepID=UPI00340182FE